MRPLRLITRSNTASHITPPAIYQGMLHIPPSSNRQIRIPAIPNHALQSNLLSVHNIAEKWQEVKITLPKAIVLNTSTDPLWIVSKAVFAKGMYYLQLAQVHFNTMAERTAPLRTSKPAKAPSPKTARRRKISIHDARQQSDTWRLP